MQSKELQNLRECPFCGSTKLKIDKKSTLTGYNGLSDRVEHHTFSIRCNVCHARGATVGRKVVPYLREEYDLPSWATTDNQLKEQAIKAWNTRNKEDKEE